MATYNKPGVYVEETLTPNAPTPSVVSQSVAAFIGYSDRGPTANVSNNVVGVPTLVSNWSEFVNLFSYGANINTFSGVPALVIAGVTSSGTDMTLSTGTTERLKVGSVISIVSGTGTLNTAEPTIVTGVSSSSSFTVNVAPAIDLAGATVSATPNSDLKYAVKSFFDNGGSQAYILRDVNPDAIKASVDIQDQNSVLNISENVVFNGQTANWSDKKVVISTVSTTSTLFSGFTAGKTVTFSGIPAGDFDWLNNNTWVVDSATATTLTIIAAGASAVATNYTLVSTTSSAVITGGAASDVPTLRVSAKSAGSWGNNIWVGVYPNAAEGFFDLDVYYDISATSAASITSGDRVERFTYLNMNPDSDRYVTKIVNSTWIEVEDLDSTATGNRRLPAFTGGWGGASSYNVDPNNEFEFKWNVTNFTPLPSAVRLGIASDVNVTSTVTFGTDGYISRTASNLVSRFDAVSSPLLINWAGNSKTADINALLGYASSRGDSFVIIDAANVDVPTVLSSTSDKGIGSYSQGLNYGAAYFPYIVIADPASTTGGTKTVAPGGAVAAIYGSTDSSRGVFKAPAGSTSIVRTAVSVPSLSSADFNLIGNNNVNLNVIRFVPGSGICVMGSRTLSNQFVDRYVPVRRTLNYLGSTLKNVTGFAVFEPNDANLWARVNSVVNAFLNDFWRQGGLAGATSEQAFYVKCDSSINTPTTIGNGELHIEVGVALQKPAEFVIIRIGQLDGGATVTTSV